MSTNIKDISVKHASVFKVWNTVAAAINGKIIVHKNDEILDVKNLRKSLPMLSSDKRNCVAIDICLMFADQKRETHY